MQTRVAQRQRSAQKLATKKECFTHSLRLREDHSFFFNLGSMAIHGYISLFSHAKPRSRKPHAQPARGERLYRPAGVCARKFPASRPITERRVRSAQDGSIRCLRTITIDCVTSRRTLWLIGCGATVEAFGVAICTELGYDDCIAKQFPWVPIALLFVGMCVALYKCRPQEHEHEAVAADADADDAMAAPHAEQAHV